MEKIKCSNCKGTGHVPSYHGGGRYEVCPICHGTGMKIIHDKGGNSHGSNQTKRSSNKKN
jgi:DnaJ-class molecular chaperone